MQPDGVNDAASSQEVEVGNNEPIEINGDLQPVIASDPASSQDHVNKPRSILKEKKVSIKLPEAGDIIKYKVDEASEWVSAQVLSRAGKTSGKNKHCLNIKSV